VKPHESGGKEGEEAMFSDDGIQKSHKIQLIDVTKVFSVPKKISGSDIVAIERVSLYVEDKELVSLVGPSGCGKTTILNMLAGFIDPTEGSILMEGKPITGIDPERLVVFQTPAVFPWLNVLGNVTFGPKRRGMKKANYMKAANDIIKSVGLDGFENHYPYQLSGGMKQRLQIARTLINNPEVILMDEPFGALDAQTRLSMQEMLLDIWEIYHPTILFITHDVEEAVFLSDRVYVMSARPGSIRDEISIPFSKPRDFKVLNSEEFYFLKRRVFNLLHEKETGTDD
jgi:NitT/TauT family transport system ATP-binding protein